jgi:hypothetical protein
MVNIDELRKKYQEINNPGGANKDNKEFLEKFFMMEEGTSLVRILPGKNDQEFYAETAIHRINDKNYHCPRVKGDKCPVCDTYFKAKIPQKVRNWLDSLDRLSPTSDST